MVRLAGYLATLARLALLLLPLSILYIVFSGGLLTYLGNHPWALVAFFVFLLAFRLAAPVIKRVRKAYGG